MILENIKWDIDRDIDINNIYEIESLWKIKLPKNYVNIVIHHDGGNPLVKGANNDWQYGSVDIPRWPGKTIGFGFISYRKSKYSGKPEILDTYDAYKNSLPEPEKIFPFAETGGGDIFLFDYRKNSNEPSIVFLDHARAFTVDDLTEEELRSRAAKEWLEQNLYPVCDSFSELLDLIYIED